MGCNCKGKKQILNNLKNQEVLELVKETLSQEVEGKSIEEIDNLGWTSLYGTWNLVYPNSTGTPDKQKVIDDLQNSLQFLKKTHKKR